ncbi:MAG: OmpA family protein [Phycisphaerae bacterium]
MRTALSIPLAIVAAGMLLGGCVPQEKYDKAVAAWRRADQQLSDCQTSLRRAKTEQDRLQQQIERREGALGTRQEELALRDTQVRKLEATISRLQDMLREATADADDPVVVGPIRVLPVKVDKALKEFAKSNPELVEYLPEYGMVKLKADLTFKPGSADVKSEAEEVLGKFADIVKSINAKDFNVYVAGHTDNMPIQRPSTKRRHPNNWYLSVHRAVAVQKQLVGGGVQAERIGVMGFGEYHPVAPNAPGKKGNVKNRRVEIWLVPPGRFLTAARQES